MEERLYTKMNEIRRSARSTFDIKCPFCKTVVTAYIWSLNGCGKKCPCGAIHYGNGVTRK